MPPTWSPSARPSATAGPRSDPLYRCRRLLTKAEQRLDDNGRTKLVGLLDAGDPPGEVHIVAP